MTTVEHALPVSQLYDDVLILYAMSGTGATPTHLVNYGGVMAEQLVWANHPVPNDPKYTLIHMFDSRADITFIDYVGSPDMTY